MWGPEGMATSWLEERSADLVFGLTCEVSKSIRPAKSYRGWVYQDLKLDKMGDIEPKGPVIQNTADPIIEGVFDYIALWMLQRSSWFRRIDRQ